MQIKKIQPGVITIILILIAVLVWLQYKLWFENHSLTKWLQLKNDIQNQQQENATLQKRNQNLQIEVRRLKNNSEAIVEQARSQLGMVQPGETFYRVIEADADE